MNPTYQVDQLRRFFIYEAHLPEVDGNDIAVRIKRYLSDQKNVDNGVGKFNAKHSHFQLSSMTNMFSDLFAAIDSRVQEIDKSRNDVYNFFKPSLHRSWCAMFGNGDYLDWHVHEDRYMYNTVYYPQDHESTICLEDSNDKILEIKPRKGNLLIMQGSIKHKVSEVNTNAPRFIVAADFIYRSL